MEFEGKIILVTGASRGIGKATAMQFAKQGATVIGTATTSEGAEKISAYLDNLEMPNVGMGLKLDLGSKESIDSFIAQVADKFGEPQILVNNAGITADNLFLRLGPADWDKVLQVNLTGTYYLIKSCIRSMVKSKWGRIINLSSVVAFSGNPGQANYCAAKAGLVGLTKSLALEVASRGITVNSVAPGFIQTDMTNKLNEDQTTKILEQVPLKRMGEPDDVAHAVVFLASRYANYITGETIHVNGGMLMH